MKRKLLIPKLMGILTAVSLLFQSVPAYAENTDYNAEGDVEVAIAAVVGDNFTVGIPTNLTMTKDTGSSYTATFVKQAYGDISSGKVLKVTPADQNDGTAGVQVKISSGEGLYKVDRYLTLTDSKTEYTTLELNGTTTLNETEYDGVATTVTVAGEIPAGNWSGVLTYTIALADAQ